ncbi:unnamed protein product, partial [Strongylus vulgaris]
MRLYGSDKPDMRIPWKIEDCTEQLGWVKFYSSVLNLLNVANSYLRKSTSSKDWTARFIVCKGQAEYMKRSVKKEFQRILNMNKLSRPFAILDKNREVWFKNLSAAEMSKFCTVEDGDCVAFSWGDEEGVQWTLGQLRNLIAEVGGLRQQKKICAHWIVDFPLFTVEEGKLSSTHHPFTAPIGEHREWLNNPAKIHEITGQHYDLVMNGVELGGGSIRIHNPGEQAHVLKILGEETEEMGTLSAFKNISIKRVSDETRIGEIPFFTFSFGKGSKTETDEISSDPWTRFVIRLKKAILFLSVRRVAGSSG